MSLRLCCPKTSRANREEQYHVKDDEAPNYSWERNRADPANYQLTKLYGEIIAKLDGHVAGQQFIIDKCKECCILILDHTASVNVDDCENCLIVLGPCKGSVFVRDCINCAVFAVCQQFRARDCCNIDVFVFCATKPIIESCRLMRFRPLLLCYDKLEEHMQKSSLSPFTNNWRNVHDFTPEQVENFKILPTSYETVENMSLISNLEKVKFSKEVSFFPPFADSALATAKGEVSLVLCKQLANEVVDLLHQRAMRLVKRLVADGAQIVATKDVSIKKGDMYALLESRQSAKYSGRIVSIEVACDRAVVLKEAEQEGEAVEVVSEEDFQRYRTSLYRLAQIQMDV